MQLDTLAKGHVASATTTLLHICRNTKSLSLHFKAYDQEFFSANARPPVCYSESDINPYNKPFFSGIFYESSLVNYLIDCISSGIKHNASIIDGVSTLNWTAVMDILWQESLIKSSRPVLDNEMSATHHQ